MIINDCLITIVLPVSNAETYIKRVLSNIAEQTFHHYEILLIDNLSTDATLLIANDFKTKDNRIEIQSEVDNGIYDAMNKGISLAKGQWLYFIGVDDEFHDKNVLFEISRYLSDDVDIVYGDSLWVPENVVEAGEWTNEILIQRNINHQRIFYRKSIFQKYGLYQMKYRIAADNELNIRFFSNPSISKRHVPILIAKYYSGGFSAHRVDINFLNEWEEIFLKNFQSQLPKKVVYGSMGTSVRYMIDTHQYFKAFRMLLRHSLCTYSLGFSYLMVTYFFRKLRVVKNKI